MPEHADPQSGAAPGSGPRASQGDSEAGKRETPGAQSGGGEAQLLAWLALGRQTLDVVEQFATVVRLEVGLAVSDSKRLVIVLLAMIPLMLLAWVALCVLLAWLAYVASGSVALGLAAFLMLQVVSLFLLLRAARTFQRSLGLPASRRQWKTLMQAAGSPRDESGGSA